jgi:hypothetical protein
MPRNKSEEFALLQRRKQVAEMYLRGQTQWEIARQVGVNQAQVSRDLKVLRREWLGSALQDYDARKAQELAKIDQVEQEAWAAWKRSQEPVEIIKASTDGNGKRVEKTTKGQCGDPRFLQVIADCIRRRGDIVGLKAPARREVTGPRGQPIENNATISFYMPENGRDDGNPPAARSSDEIPGLPG